jgi:serine phosphatase RsbU (regulator of sigma subunit)
LKENDKIYLASDGFADQFGGAEGKKFQNSRLMKLLAQNAEHELNEQKNLLETTFNEWKNSNNQVDDVTVLGIKV